MAKYKNTTKHDLMIPDIGIVKAGETAEMPEGFNNANFERVSESDSRRRETIIKGEEGAGA